MAGGPRPCSGRRSRLRAPRQPELSSRVQCRQPVPAVAVPGWPCPGRAPGLRRGIPTGTAIEYRKKSLLGAPLCPVAAVHHGCCAQVVVLYSIPVPTGVHRRSQGAQPVHGDRGMVPRTQCPEAALLCIQSTRNPQGAQWFSLSLPLSRSPSLCLSPILRKLNWYYCDAQCC